jgi:hypothetical protein
MNIQARKLQVMRLIIETKNIEILESIEKLLKNEIKEDFWNSLTTEQKNEIELSISEIEMGETVDFDSFMDKYIK